MCAIIDLREEVSHAFQESMEVR